MSSNEKQVKADIQATSKKSTKAQDEWLAAVLKVELRMQHGWTETFDWGADAEELIAAFEQLRQALSALAAIDPALVAARERIKAAMGNIAASQITNDKTIRGEKQREIDALTAHALALKTAGGVLASLAEPECRAPAEATKQEQQAIAQATTAVRTRLAGEVTPAAVALANNDRAALVELVKTTAQTIIDRKAWNARHGVVDKRYQQATKGLDPELAPKLQAWWQAVSGAEAAKDYVQALAGVEQFALVLAALPATQAAAAQARRQQAVADKTLEKNDAKALKKDLDVAEDLLARLDQVGTAVAGLEAARLAFEAASKACVKALDKRAKEMESSDGGHSIDRHGPGVTDDLLKRRVDKGLAADGVLSPTHSSTRFDKVEDWLETRDAAIRKILADNGVTATSAAPLPGTSYTSVLEHNKPIDSGFVADKTSAVDEVMKDDMGAPVYELKKGKKRWARNDKAEPLNAKGAVVPYGGPDKDPKNKAGQPVAADDHVGAVWPDGTDPPVLKVKTYKVYTAHVKVSGLTRTLTTIEWDGTKWKVVQHFPHAEGWDPKTKTYTTPI